MEDERRLDAARHRLIEDLRETGVDDLDILRRFDRVPRHAFVAGAHPADAYRDRPMPIGHGQSATRPSVLARYLQVLGVGGKDRVLEVGTGSGFSAALLAVTAERVVSVERVRPLSVGARDALDRQGIRNTALVVGDGSIGWARLAPYDVVAVMAAASAVPGPLVDQLADPGRLLIPLQAEERQSLLLVRKAGGRTTEEVMDGSVDLGPLVGRWAPGAREER